MQIPQVPKILKKKLIFGDTAQIDALREYEKKYEAYFGDGTEKPFFVHVEYSRTIRVVAKSEKEAEDLARNEIGYFSDRDLDFSAEEINEKRDC